MRGSHPMVVVGESPARFSSSSRALSTECVEHEGVELEGEDGRRDAQRAELSPDDSRGELRTAQRGTRNSGRGGGALMRKEK